MQSNKQVYTRVVVSIIILPYIGTTNIRYTKQLKVSKAIIILEEVISLRQRQKGPSSR